jgi:hypothetical protein
MSYRDPTTGEWIAGAPPRGVDALYLNAKGGKPTPAELRSSEINLSDSHPRQAVPARLVTEKAVGTVLNLSLEQIYNDAQLVGAAQVVGGAVMFDATVVVERAYKAQSGRSVDTGTEDPDDVSMRANELVAEMKRQGIELPGGLGGDAA